MEKTAEPREKWSSRLAFITAAVGAAVGLGNLWRFPALCYEYGGGAFFIPYALFLVMIGIPILILEVALGQYHQRSVVVCFGRIHPRLSGVGLASVWCGFVIVCYYAVLLGWTIRLFGLTFNGASPWSGRTGGDAWVWFTGHITGLATVNDDSLPTEVVPMNVLCLAMVWVLIFLSLVFGVRSTGRLTYVTVLLPIFLLLVLLIRAATLPGHQEGFTAYMGVWDISLLLERHDVWSRAATQIFFSLSVTVGIMTAYGSYNPRSQPVTMDCTIIALCDALISVMCGFAVFGIIGYLAHAEGVSIADLPDVAGPALMFGTLPVALSTLPGAGHWERLCFIVVLLLGIDSAFSLVEAVVAVIQDIPGSQRLSRRIWLSLVCLVGFLFGLLYCSNSGLLFLDTNDFYVNFVMLLVGVCETVSAGWVFGIEAQSARLGSRLSTYGFAGTTLIAAVAGTAVGLTSGADCGILCWVVVYLAGYAFCFMNLPERGVHNAKELFLGNIEELRQDLADVMGPIPVAWSVTVKHICPNMLFALFWSLAFKTKNDVPLFGGYEGYPLPYQVVGICMAMLSVLIIVLGIAFPKMFGVMGSTQQDDDTAVTLTPKLGDENPGAVHAEL
eukprot:TRINITY_DN113248_c0_g1_i1.p1 TRINITY_DN113248_c0_g1~~TRINITY_DN113248_c0_g1_i1.p1  ORF type:complete len:614 (-),score=61.21 TRINITY_DN113248_c0_g1_i1:216-2057(-)